jgi:hypothetical protein
MLRIAVISSIFLAACDVGSIQGAGTDGGSTDGSGSGSSCENVAASPPDGHHNPGMGCRSAASCHNAALGLGAGAPEYSYGGTLYKDQAGTMPYGGATIFFTQGTKTVKTTTATNGNFWLPPALLAGPSATMTSKTKASACPNTTEMAGALTAGGGDCNSGSCHAPGSTQGPIYVLP